jgi:ferredoxin-NADP reductase
MVSVNKTVGDIILREQLEALAQTHGDRFECHFLVTRENVDHLGPYYRQGRPTTDFIRSLLKDPARVHVYACGAAISKWDRERAKEQGTEAKPRFMESVHEIVEGLGIERARFKKEVFG